MEAGGKLVILQSPVRGDEQFLGRLRDEPFQGDTGAEPLDEVDDEVDVFIGREKVELLGSLGELPRHAGVPDEL